MTGPTSRTERNPRAFLAFLVVLLMIQGFYAGLEILPLTSTGGTGLLLGAGFVVYALMIAAFAYGAWRQAAWAWHLAVAITLVGLALAAIRLADGAPISKHILGMAIDGGLLLYLQRPSIKALFGR